MTIHDPLAGIPIDWTLKGAPPFAEGYSFETFAKHGVSLFDEQLLFPIATLSASILNSNSSWMRNFITHNKVKLAPHGKTTMAPALFSIQQNDGVWGMTAATVHQVRAYRKFGVQRIILANQLIGAAAVKLIASELKENPDFEFWCLVDSVENAQAVAAMARAFGCPRPIRMLLEVGAPGARAGVRSIKQGLEVAHAVNECSPSICLSGVECFEGLFAGPDAETNVKALLELTVETARACAELDLFADGPIILSAGGSAYFDLAAQALNRADIGRETNIIIRSGCYLTHDSGMYKDAFRKISIRTGGALEDGLKGALHIWAYVQSAPEPSRIICNFGKRDAGEDAGLPQPLAFVRPGQTNKPIPIPAGHIVVKLNDQHAYLDAPIDTPLAIGDLVCFGISHPCTTFDKWRAIFLIDDSYRIVDLIRTYF